MTTHVIGDGSSIAVEWSMDEIRAIFDHMDRCGIPKAGDSGDERIESDRWLVNGCARAMNALDDAAFNRKDQLQIEIVLRAAFAYMRGKCAEDFPHTPW